MDRHQRIAMHNAQHYVYELWAGEECLYVGVSSALGRRLTDHQYKPWFARVTHIVATAAEGNRHDARRVERERIDDLQPTYNLMGTERQRGRAVMVPLDD